MIIKNLKKRSCLASRNYRFIRKLNKPFMIVLLGFQLREIGAKVRCVQLLEQRAVLAKASVERHPHRTSHLYENITLEKSRP